jgi:hypothetical protein
MSLILFHVAFQQSDSPIFSLLSRLCLSRAAAGRARPRFFVWVSYRFSSGAPLCVLGCRVHAPFYFWRPLHASTRFVPPVKMRRPHRRPAERCLGRAIFCGAHTESHHPLTIVCSTARRTPHHTPSCRRPPPRLSSLEAHWAAGATQCAPHNVCHTRRATPMPQRAAHTNAARCAARGP